MTASAEGFHDDELLISRTFDAPVALVFRLWEDRDHMIRWWGPEKFTCTALDWELTPGRRWHSTMAAKDWGMTGMGGVIREVERNKRIIFTFKWDRDGENPVDTLIAVTFEERNGQTIESFHQTPFVSVAARDSHIGGWNSLINKQQLYVENMAIAERAAGHKEAQR